METLPLLETESYLENLKSFEKAYKDLDNQFDLKVKELEKERDEKKAKLDAQIHGLQNKTFRAIGAYVLQRYKDMTLITGSTHGGKLKLVELINVKDLKKFNLKIYKYLILLYGI